MQFGSTQATVLHNCIQPTSCRCHQHMIARLTFKVLPVCLSPNSQPDAFQRDTVPFVIQLCCRPTCPLPPALLLPCSVLAMLLEQTVAVPQPPVRQVSPYFDKLSKGTCTALGPCFEQLSRGTYLHRAWASAL